jgi:hypothetical protein
MLILQARRVRIWAVTMLVAAYAFGILGPTLAFSLEDKVSIVHSLTEGHGGSLVLHLHHDDTDHQVPGQRGPHVGHDCCGVFGLVGLFPSDAVLSTVDGYAALARTEPKDEHAIRQPNRLDRPPRTIL